MSAPGDRARSGTSTGQIRPTRKPDPQKRADTNDFLALAKDVRHRGLMERHYGYYWTKIVLTVLAVAACILVFIVIGDSWWQMATAVALAFVLTHTAFLGHDAAHRQIFRSGKWNAWLSMVLGNLIVGMSFGWWQNKHGRHHDKPNQMGADPDIEIPVIAVSEERAAQQKRSSGIVRWLTAHQGWFFFPVLLLEGLSLHASGFRRILQREAMPHRWVELAFLVLRFAALLTLVFWVLSPGKAVAFLGIQVGLFGFYLGMSFSPNHKGMPIVPKDARLDFFRHQVMMSRNIRGPKIIDFLMGGLNYQIEHHLFPSMPRPHIRTVAPLVQEYCRKLDVPYTETGLWESYGIVVRYINRVGLGERDVFECPLMTQRQALG